MSSGDVRTVANQEGYEPIQPINFSHRLHAGKLDVDCKFCHTGVETSRHAGFPPTKTCIGCHKFIPARMNDIKAERALAKTENRPEKQIVSEEIQKIYDSYGLDRDLQPDSTKLQVPIKWTKVHNLGDFVWFDHHKHVNGGVDCASCHGQVDSMERIKQTKDMNMGWCISCHRKENAAFNSSNSMIDFVEEKAGIDCANCHY